METHDNSIYKRWTDITYTCFTRACRCKGCTNYFDCKDITPTNKYSMPNIKYAAMMIFANTGKEGLERYRARRDD